jgi:GDP-L-fucose synthase
LTTEHKKPIEIKDKNLHIFKGDLTDFNFCNQITKNVDYVFCCACNKAGASVLVNNPLLLVFPNLVIWSSLLEYSCRNGVNKFLFISGNTVYPASKKVLKEDDIDKGPVPKSYQGLGDMRRYIESLCILYNNQSKMNVSIVRPSAIYGPRDNFNLETATVIPSLINKVNSARDSVEVWGNGEDLRDFIYVNDLVKGLLLVMAANITGNPINISFGKSIKIRDLINKIIKVSNKDIVIKFNDQKPSTVPCIKISNQKAKDMVDFVPQYSIDKGLEETINWYRIYTS